MGGLLALLALLVSVIAGRFNKFYGGIAGVLLTALAGVVGSANTTASQSVSLLGVELPPLLFIALMVLLYLFNAWQVFTSVEFAERIGALDSTALVLIPLLIGINIAGGQLVKALRLPIYLDSIGTVMAGALLGPWAGLLTGLLSNTIWTLIGLDSYAYAFAIVAGVIGLLAGFAGRAGFFQRESPPWLSALIGGVFLFALSLFVLLFLNATPNEDGTLAFPPAGELLRQADSLSVVLIAFVIGGIGGFMLLRNGGYAGLAGLATGLIAATVSAPIVTFLFGGVTGAGTDVLVAAFRAAGASIIQSAFAQGAVSDPFDKLTSFMVVWLIIQSLPRRLLVRFPNTRAREVAAVASPAAGR